jgi:hypothetical protein
MAQAIIQSHLATGSPSAAPTIPVPTAVNTAIAKDSLKTVLGRTTTPLAQLI